MIDTAGEFHGRSVHNAIPVKIGWKEPSKMEACGNGQNHCYILESLAFGEPG